MAAIVADQQGQPRFGSTCSGCEIGLNHLPINGVNTCSKCERVFCTKCSGPNMKLDLSSGASSSERYCIACEKLVTRNKELSSSSKTTDGERANRSEMSHEESLQERTFPTKPPRIAPVRNSMPRAYDNDPSLDKGGHPIYFKAYGLSGESNIDDSVKPSPSITLHMYEPQSRSTNRFRAKRNARGLCSKSDIRNVDDNRYSYLNFPERNSGENITTDITNRNRYTKVANEPLNIPHSMAQNWRSSETNKEPKFPITEHADERADKYEEVLDNERTEKHTQNFQLFKRINQSGQEEVERKSDRRLYNRKNQSDHTVANFKPKNFLQNSQFYSESIVYPSWTEGHPYSGHRHPVKSGHQRSHNSYDSGDQNFGFRDHMHAPSLGSTQNERSAQFEGVHPNTSVFRDDIEDFDDLDDIPAYDEIPFALIITENVDKKTLIRANRKQMQQDALELIKQKAVKSKTSENKNKNQGPFSSKDIGNKTDTYMDQVLAERKTNKPEEAFQIHERNITKSSDAVSQLGNGLSKRTDNSYTDDLRIQSKDDKTDLGAVKAVTESNFTVNVKVDKQDRDIGIRQSPVKVADKKKDEAASFAISHFKVEQVSTENDKPTNTFLEKQKNDAERFIREKRLEKLKGENLSSENKEKDKKLKQKPDNREVAFHSDAVYKPVKATAFRSKVPNFRSDNAPEETTSHVLKAVLGTNVVAEPDQSKTESSLSSTESRHDGKPDKQPLAMKLVQGKATSTKMSVPQSTKSSENLAANKQNDSHNLGVALDASKNSNTKDKESDSEMSEEEPVPVAMRLLKEPKHSKMKLSGKVRKPPSFEHSDDNKEDMIEPIAMRLLRQFKEEKEQKETFSQTGSSSESLFAALSILGVFGGKSSKLMRGNKRSSPAPSDQGRGEIKSAKQETKNKNKNLSPLKQKRQESSIVKANDSKDSEDAAGENGPQMIPVSSSSSVQKYTKEPAGFVIVADVRHKRFQKLKMSQSENHLKCTSCGRSDCGGHNIKKMKDIIRMANQAGFEVRDVSPDGNCMFAAIVDQLQLYGDYRFGPKSLREAAVAWLIEHPYSDDGTHYASFLSEDWELYVQRMMVEGEWGDHLILRAIVETIGHTVKVLHVSGEESHWTILEPTSIDTSRDGMHLVLGHVGEFHYISLRPADKSSRSFVPAPLSPMEQSRLVADDDGQTALEGTETIEMFREDYIDTLSDLPSAHFSYLLKYVIPLKVVSSAAIMQSQYMDLYSNPSQTRLLDTATGVPLETETELGGSIAEGLYVPHLNEMIDEDGNSTDNVTLDVYAIMKKYIVVREKSRDIIGEGRIECEIDTSGLHIGYTKLLSTQRLPGRNEEYSRYLPQVKMTLQQQHANETTWCALRCQVWPECAKPWVSRVRREGWPSKDIISSIESEGCLLLPIAHKESKCPDIEWQFSFTVCERRLFRDAVSLYQKYCYILFDALCTQTIRHLVSISSTHLKSVFFYACERIPAEYWESSPGACVFYMLDELLRYVRAKNLPNYFVQANNMVDHLFEKDFKEIEEQIVLLRSQPVLFLRQIDESFAKTPPGNSVINNVSDDIPKFKEHRSVKQSTLEVFIPATIDKAQYYIRMRLFEQGYEILSQAFQERLSVSTCDDSVPFQIFLAGAVSGLDLDTLVWFSAYTDRQLEGQLSKSLVRETCGDLQLVKIKDILPADVVGSYGNTEIPIEFSGRLCSFCHDFAKFLYETNKLSEILPILYHCHDIFMKLETSRSSQAGDGKHGEQRERTDFTDEAMFNIYTAMYAVYFKQQQLEFFRAVMPSVESIVERIHTRWAYNCLCCIYQELGDQAKKRRNAEIYYQLPEDPMEQVRVATFLYWPKKVKKVPYTSY